MRTSEELRKHTQDSCEHHGYPRPHMRAGLAMRCAPRKGDLMIWSFLNFHVGSLLGGDSDPRAVARLNLPTFESVEPSRSEAGKGKGPGDRSTTKEPEMEQEVAPFIICETLPVVPAKLVKKILKGDFVDMAELLNDNMEAERRRYSAKGELGQSGISQRGSRREVPDIMSWVQCYSMYAGVICNKYREKARELWAYQAGTLVLVVVREHRVLAELPFTPVGQERS